MKSVTVSMLAFLLAFSCFADEKDIAREKAVELTQQGLAHFGSLEDPNWPVVAVDYYEYAITVDPTYGPVYANLAIAEHAMWAFGREDKETAEQKAKWAVAKAMFLEPKLSTTYSADGLIKYKFDNDYDGAFESFAKAVELDPEDTGSRIEYAWAFIHAGQFDAALEQAQKAQELSPDSELVADVLGQIYKFKQDNDKAIEAWSKLSATTPVRYGRIAEAYLDNHEYDKAMEYADKGLSIFPNNNWLKNIKGRVYDGKGMYDEALATFKETKNQVGSGVTWAHMGQTNDAHGVIVALKEGEYKDMWWNYWNMAYISLLLGEKEKALDLLETTYEKIDPNPYTHYMFGMELDSDEVYDTVRSDERFQKLIEKTGYTLEPAQPDESADLDEPAESDDATDLE